MLEPHPPRREPRLMVLRLVRGKLHYAVIDPWEVRGLGVLPFRVGLRLALTRLVVQTRPTVLVSLPLIAKNASLVRPALKVIAKRRGLPLIELDVKAAATLRRAAPSADQLADQYPEMRGLDPVPVLDLLPLAFAALTTLTFPPRTYVSRQSSPSAPGLAARGARGPRPPPVPHRRPARPPVSGSTS